MALPVLWSLLATQLMPRPSANRRHVVVASPHLAQVASAAPQTPRKAPPGDAPELHMVKAEANEAVALRVVPPERRGSGVMRI